MEAEAQAKLTIRDAIGDLDFDPDELKRKYAFERDKRLRTDGRTQYVPTVDGKFKNFSKDPWADAHLTRDPITDHTEIFIAGGGFGGLLAGARLREAGFKDDIRIVEEGGDFGGTWYWNRYPGAMCDIEAHIYLPLLEELNYMPKHRYSYAEELLDHSRHIGKHYDLYKKATFSTIITSAKWQDDQNQWVIETDRGDRFTARYAIFACGRQSLPKLPGVPGIEQFAGHAFHSSRWDYNYTGGSERDDRLTKLRDKTVAVIGTAATAVQIVPEVAKWAQQTYVVQRTPSSLGVRGQCITGPNWVDTSVPGWQKARQENFQRFISGDPPSRDDVRDSWTELSLAMIPIPASQIEEKLGRKLTGPEKGYLSEIADHKVMNALRARIDSIVEDPEVAEALKPWYRWACKRPCFHDEYLAAFNKPNVRLVDTDGKGVEAFTPNGFIAAGEEFDADCVIFATGFEAGINYTRLTGFEIYGRNGTALSEHWANGVRTLHGMTTDRFPNCFFIGGNAHSAAAVNAVHLLDEQSKHVAYMLERAQEGRHLTLEPNPAAVDAYTDEIKNSPTGKALLRLFAECTPGYFNAEGSAEKAEDLFTGGRYGDGPLAFYQLLSKWRENDGAAQDVTFS